MLKKYDSFGISTTYKFARDLETFLFIFHFLIFVKTYDREYDIML